jgi:hypothetical protein
LAQRVSIIELMRSEPAGDYRAFVQQARLSMLLMRDPRLLPLLMTEMRAKLVEAGVDPDDDEIGKGARPKGWQKALAEAFRRMCPGPRHAAPTANRDHFRKAAPPIEGCLRLSHGLRYRAYGRQRCANSAHCPTAKSNSRSFR